MKVGPARLTLQGEEDGEAPLVDGEDAVEGCSQHEGGHGHLPRVEAAVARGRVGRAGTLVRGPQLGGYHPLRRALQVQQACTCHPRDGLSAWGGTNPPWLRGPCHEDRAAWDPKC